MKFNNRKEAAEMLVQKLLHYKGKEAVVLAIPRGGLELGYIIAKELNIPLDVVLTKKIRHPIYREFAIGAVSLNEFYLNNEVDVSQNYLDKEIKERRSLLQEKKDLYYTSHNPVAIKNKIAIIVDDGIATGSTLLATIHLVKKSRPEKIVVAVPVSSPSGLEKLENSVADEVICLHAPYTFRAVGQFYKTFEQVNDYEVIEYLEKADKFITNS